jgi:hypothetical protein
MLILWILLLGVLQDPALASQSGFSVVRPLGQSAAEPARVTVSVQQLQLPAGVEQELNDRVDGFNVANPLADDANTQRLMSTPGALAEMQKLLQNPLVQRYVKIMSNPAILNKMNALITHPKRMNMVYSEIGLFLFLIVFRAWRSSKYEHWLGRAWVGFYSFFLGLILALVVVPAFVFGSIYIQFINEFAKAAFK